MKLHNNRISAGLISQVWHTLAALDERWFFADGSSVSNKFALSEKDDKRIEWIWLILSIGNAVDIGFV